uniref:Uncharacterized protein n=1 Tax=Anopheles culicifacies TaxID=139723 RepID=A0A182MMN0_9DIPT
MLNGTSASASKVGVCTIGISFVVWMLRVATFVPAELPTYGTPWFNTRSRIGPTSCFSYRKQLTLCTRMLLYSSTSTKRFYSSSSDCHRMDARIAPFYYRSIAVPIRNRHTVVNETKLFTVVCCIRAVTLV